MFGYWLRDSQTIEVPSGVPFLKQEGRAAELAISAEVILDNRIPLRQTLRIPTAKPLSDAALVLQAYARWGRDCCQYLIGSYSFVIWDAGEKSLFCARDHIGSTPFYYTLTSAHFVFATSISKVFSTPLVSNELDDRFVRTKLAHKFYADNERTFYKAVKKLSPGHSLTVWPQRSQIQRYWFPENAPDCRLPNDDTYASTFIELLQDIVATQLPTEQPTGVHLSGGLDSSLVTRVVAQSLQKRDLPLPIAYSWLPPPVKKRLPPEHDLLEQVRTQSQLAVRFQQPTVLDIERGLARDLTLMPAAEMLFHEQIVMRQAMKDNVRTILSGWGGDETIAFNGRSYYAGLLRSGQWMRHWRESRAVTNCPIRHIFNHGILPQYPWLRRLRKHVRKRRLRLPFQYYLNTEFMRQVQPYLQQSTRQLNTRQTQLNLLNYGYLAARMETWAAVGKAHNLVYRYPLLDKRIVEFALGLPPEMFRRGEWNRWLMRYSVAKLLPHDVAWNPDKSDPTRHSALISAMRKASQNIGHQLRTQAARPSRATYLDMPRLLADLTPDALAKRDRGFGKLWDALLFLDFENDY